MTDATQDQPPETTKRKRAAPVRLTPERLQSFLDHLSATCHAEGAAAAAGVTIAALGARRLRDPAFAAAWRAAVELGYDRLEEALLRKALDGLEVYSLDPGKVALELVDGHGAGDAGDDAGGGGADATAANERPVRRGGVRMAAGLTGPVARIDVQLALAILNRHGARAKAGAERSAAPRPTPDEVARALTRQLDILSRRFAVPKA